MVVAISSVCDGDGTTWDNRILGYRSKIMIYPSTVSHERRSVFGERSRLYHYLSLDTTSVIIEG